MENIKNSLRQWLGIVQLEQYSAKTRGIALERKDSAANLVELINAVKDLNSKVATVQNLVERLEAENKRLENLLIKQQATVAKNATANKRSK